MRNATAISFFPLLLDPCPLALKLSSVLGFTSEIGAPIVSPSPPPQPRTPCPGSPCTLAPPGSSPGSRSHLSVPIDSCPAPAGGRGHHLLLQRMEEERPFLSHPLTSHLAPPLLIV
ncbi:hypothetical protein B0T22DRAFT_468458 [Podospora appendiculata]|uniref:Uncharacterized protein n=1 Tax=Podospora appendiculata TaxID=314037 RepID=A0AAE0X396_9PEZI|nr:hypothetical protein B0T22DRAFT_468458 [Podospora appendiculata]